MASIAQLLQQHEPQLLEVGGAYRNPPTDHETEEAPPKQRQMAFEDKANFIGCQCRPAGV